MKDAIILGAGSGVGRSLAETLAKNGSNLILCSRNIKDLEANAANISLRFGAEVQVFAIDINKETDRDALIGLIKKNKTLGDIFITIGEISENDNGLQSSGNIELLAKTNFLSITLFLSSLLQSFDKSEKRNIILLSSIAVARPRGNNLLYATSKNAVDFYARGLQHLLANTSIKIQIFRLGYIDTSMSFGKKLLLTPVSSSYTAKKILSKRNSPKRIHYIPGYWKFLTFLIKMIPWTIYKKMQF